MVVVNYIRAIEAHAQNGILPGHQIVDRGHNVSFSSTAWIVVRRRSLVVSNVNVQIGFVGSTEVASFAMRLQVQMVYKLLNIHYSVEPHQFKRSVKKFSPICAHALNSAHAYHSAQVMVDTTMTLVLWKAAATLHWKLCRY